MLNNLNSNNSSGDNAVVNKKLKDLEQNVNNLESQISQLEEKAENTSKDIVDINEKLSAPIDEDEAKVKHLYTDRIDTIIEEKLQLSDVKADTIETTNIDTTTLTVNGVDFEEYRDEVNQANARSRRAERKADNAVTTVSEVKEDLESYKEEMSNSITTEQLTSTDAELGTVTAEALTVKGRLFAEEMNTALLNNAVILNKDFGFIEPTEKDETTFYQFFLPTDFHGRARFVGVLEDESVAFSALIDNAVSNMREGTGIVVHSGLTKWDFYQVLRRRDINQISFITRSSIKRLYYHYDNLDKIDVPKYTIYPNLTDEGPDYELYSTVYTAEHSDQVLVFGNEETLNGGLTIFGTFYASAFEAPETALTDVRVKRQIYGGYESETGEYTTCGTPGGLITYNERDISKACTVSWINGEPRQIVRKCNCYGKDKDGNELSYLGYEDVLHCEYPYNPKRTDLLFDETTLANYDGKTADVKYPIVHLGDTTCVHGSLEVETHTETDTFNSSNIYNTEDDDDLETGLFVSCTDGKIYRKEDNLLDEIVPFDNEVQADYEEGTPLTYDSDRRTFIASDDIKIKGSLEVGENIDTAGDITADGDLTIAGDAVVSGKSTFADDVEIKGKLDVSKNINASCDVHVAGDLYVEGTQHISKSEDLDVEADIITLRTNKRSPLADGQVSGLLVNKYDGEKDLALVTDNKGTLRVGTAKGEDTVYTDIAYDPATQKWYEWDDGELGDEVTLSSNASITSWENKRTVDSYTVYDKLTLTEIDKTTLVPLLGRSEEADLIDKHVFIWNKNKLIAETYKKEVQDKIQIVEKKKDLDLEDGELGIATIEGLFYQDGDNLLSVSGKGSGIAFVGTREELEEALKIEEGEEGYIPENALVLITDEQEELSDLSD